MDGWLIYNQGMQTEKFQTIHHRYIEAARGESMTLLPLSNAEITIGIKDNRHTLLNQKKPSFVLFLDKDIQLAMQLEAMHIPVFNSSAAIAVCDDKGLMHHTLATSALNQPDTIIAPLLFQHQLTMPQAFIDRVIKQLSFPLVMKKSFGSFGYDVHLIEDREQLLALSNEWVHTPHIYQQYIEASHGRDVRIHVVGGAVVASVLRQSTNDFRANVTNGGVMHRYEPNDAFKQLAIAAADRLGLDFCGVDLLFNEDNQPTICEVNSNAHIENVSRATGIDVAACIMNHIKRRIDVKYD